MFKLWATIVKDSRVLWRDGVGLALMFFMPIVLVFVVTDIQNSSYKLINKNKLPILVCNRDTGQSSIQLIEAINKIGMFRVSQLAEDQNEKTIADSMKKSDAMLGVVIPSNFTVKVKAKSKSVAGKALTSFGLQADSTQKEAGDVDPLTLYYNPVIQESMRLSIKGGLQSALQLVESRETLRSLYFSINEKPLPSKLEDEMLNNKTVINEIPVSKNGSLKAPNAAQHNVPSWTIFAMFFVIMSLGGSIVREKVSGSFIRLKTLPTNYMVGMLSKQITYIGVTIVQAIVIFALGIWVFPLVNLPGLDLLRRSIWTVCGNGNLWLVRRELCHVRRRFCRNTPAEQWLWRDIYCNTGCSRRFDGAYLCNGHLAENICQFIADALVFASLLRLVFGRRQAARRNRQPNSFSNNQFSISIDKPLGLEKKKFNIIA